MIRKRLIVNGSVSEGGIRYFAQMQASAFNLTGMAKRNDNSSVTIEVQGQVENIEKFTDKIRAGNGFYKVTSIEDENVDIIKEEKIFSIK